MATMMRRKRRSFLRGCLVRGVERGVKRVIHMREGQLNRHTRYQPTTTTQNTAIGCEA